MNARTHCQSRLCRAISDESGQDLMEYALLICALAVIVAGCIPTQVIPVISGVYSRITTSMNGS